MGYDLKPNNDAMDWFHMGAFSFPVLLEAFGYLFPCILKGARWHCVFGEDERMPAGDTCPALISNDGFPVTDEEAKIMARMARNYVAVQRSLPEQPSNIVIRQFAESWPQKIRTDFTDKFAEFAEWADKSGGFEIH